MSRDSRRTRRDRRIDYEAASWAVREDRGLSPAEQDEFLQWLGADRRHAERLARQRDTWKQLDALAEWRPEHSLEPNPSLLQPTRRLRSAAAWWFAAAAALIVSLGAVFWPKASGPTAGPTVNLTAASGYERRVLEDGSVVQLNKDTAVAAHFTAAKREVRLARGEAHFTVTKNPHRPFIVRAHDVEVRAVGTAFDVRLTPTEVQVMVTEGRVKIGRPTGAEIVSETDLIAGELAVVPLGPAPVAVHPLQPEQMAEQLSWQSTRFDFASLPLAAVVAQFNRYNSVQLVIADPALATLPIVATFRSDNVDGFVRLLEASARVEAERSGEKILLRRAP